MPERIGTGREAAAQYLEETGLAITSIHALISTETERVRSLISALRSAEARIVDKDDRRAFFEMNPDLDDEGLGTLARWELHFDDLPKYDAISDNLTDARARFDAAAFSVAVLCGAILQLAKQAIAVAEGERPKKFQGRRIHEIRLGEIVWEARNQSLHFEEGGWREPVQRVFGALDAAHPGQFQLKRGFNLAHRIFDELGWHDLERLRSDLREMTGLAPPSADTLTRPPAVNTNQTLSSPPAADTATAEIGRNHDE